MKRFVLFLILVGLTLILGFGVVKAAFPYKYVISGPGFEDAPIEVWLSDDDLMLQIADRVMVSEAPGAAPKEGDFVYNVDWWWGACWKNPTPCTEDPAGAAPVHSLYYFDAAAGQGNLYWIDRPSPMREQWIATPSEFDRAVQFVLVARMLDVFWERLADTFE